MAARVYHEGQRIGHLILITLRHGKWSAWCDCGRFIVLYPTPIRKFCSNQCGVRWSDARNPLLRIPHHMW